MALMRMRGLEPPPSYLDTDLNRARLPIPPHPRDAGRRYRNRRPRVRRLELDPAPVEHGGFASLDPEYEPPSSRGLGRRPLTAVTRVRIPLAVLQKAAPAVAFVGPGAMRRVPGVTPFVPVSHGRSHKCEARSW